jgi:hypothetical protein
VITGASKLSTFAALAVSVLFFREYSAGHVHPVADAASRSRDRRDPPDERTNRASLSGLHSSARISNGGHDRGLLLFDKLFDPIFTLALNLLYPGSHYA